MFLHKPGSTALIIASRTTAGRANIGKAVELFALCAPGERILNPVNGVMTQIPAQSLPVMCGRQMGNTDSRLCAANIYCR